MKKTYVEKDDCTSCNLCADTLPQYFRMDDDDLAESHNESKELNESENINNAIVKEDDIDKVQEAIEDCPGECILWEK